MKNSEKLLSAFSQMYFYKELVQDNLLFTPENNSQLELADLLLNLDDVIVAIQLKERNDSNKTNSVETEMSWLERQIKKAKKQIKDTMNYISNANLPPFQTVSGMSAPVIPNADIIPLLVFMNDKIKEYPKTRSIDGKTINCVSFEDFQIICQSLITPIEIIDYLEWRVSEVEKYANCDILIFDDGKDGMLLSKPKHEEALVQFYLAQVYGISKTFEFEEELNTFRYFLNNIPVRAVGESEEHAGSQLVKFLSRFTRPEIRLFLERLHRAIEKSKQDMTGIVGNQRSEKPGSEDNIFFVAGQMLPMKEVFYQAVLNTRPVRKPHTNPSSKLYIPQIKEIRL